MVISLTFLTIPRQPYALDDSLSEKMVLNYAHEKGLQFGSDIVFTYGPLGFLTSRYFFAHAAETRRLVDVLLGLTVAGGVCMLAWRLTLTWRCLLLAMFVWLAANIDPRSDLLIYSGVVCWGLLCLVESGVWLGLCAVCFTALAAFGILVKGNFVFIAGVSLLVIVCDLWMQGRWAVAIGMALGLAAGVVSGWLAAGQSLPGLGVFFARSLTIIRGYDQAVGLDGLQTLRMRGLLTLALAMGSVLLTAATVFDAKVKRWRLRRGVLGLWFCSLLFMVWKHGFVRADLYHMGYFFGFAPILALAVSVLPSEKPSAARLPRGFAVLCGLIAVLALQSFFFLDWTSSLAQPFRAARQNLATLLKPADYRQQMLAALQAARQSADLPKTREKIGNASVDVFGQDQSYALLNGMDYRPRPVFQSYLAYNTPLMRLNEAFYLSKSAPEYVLFALRPVDRKFPPLEDAMTLRTLLANYEPAGEEEPFLLLRLKSTIAPELALLREGTVRTGEMISLQDFGETNLWLEIKVEPTLQGRARELIDKSAKLRLAIWRGYTSVQIARYPAPAPMLAAGFVASPLLMTNPDVVNFYSGTAALRPKAYAVDRLPGTEKLWENDVHFRIYRIGR